MAPIPKLAPFAFLAFAAVAGYCIVGLQIRNGTFDKIDAYDKTYPTLLARKGAVDGELRLLYTGFAPIDRQLSVLVRFFWLVLDGQLPAASLFAFWGAGQIVAVYAFLMIEGMRAANRWRVLSFTTIIGLTLQNIPFGIIVPLWAALYLWTSPIAGWAVGRTDPAMMAAGLAIDDVELAVMPHSLILGYILPSVLMGLPSPRFVTIDQQQIFIAAWQAFPLWVGIIQFVLVRASRLVGAEVRMKAEEDKNKAAAHARRLRWVYIWSVGVTGITHSLTLSLIVFAKLRPSWAGEVGVGDLDWKAAFVPGNPFAAEIPQTPSLAHGALSLLQWDFYFAEGSLLLLGSQLFSAVTDAPNLASVLTLLTGPAGAALVLIWRRDEKMVLRPLLAPKQKTG